MSKKICIFSMMVTLLAAGWSARGEDWPEWGRTDSKNMTAPGGPAPVEFVPGEEKSDSEEIDLSTSKNIKWVAKLGSSCYGNPTIAQGRVLVGTNNEAPRDPKHLGDRGNIYCLDEKTGEYQWQLVVPKLGAGKVSDWEYLGICSSPTILEDKVYAITNRCEVICLDLQGLSNGNQGMQEEGKYMAPEGSPPEEVSPTDADILWVFDMRDELGVFPHNIASSSVLIRGDKLYATTSNGQDWSHINIPSPFAPAFVCLDKNTGELLGEEVEQISEHLYHCNWSSPCYGEVNGKPLVFFGAGDGFCYGFETDPVKDEDGFGVLKSVWKFDCNPPEYKVKDGEKIKYPSMNGPSEIIGTPVYYDGKVYVSIGQDPEHGSGVGRLSCIDASGQGDITKTGCVWDYKKISRSISTVSIADGLLYVSDYDGFIHCLDAKTGEVFWVHDTKSHIWGSTLVVDGKVYAGNEDGVLTVLQAGKEEKVLAEIEFNAPIYSTPVFANGVFYLATTTHLYAIESGAK